MSVRLAACCGSLVRVWDAGTGPAAAVSLLDEYRPHGRAAVNALLQPSTPKTVVVSAGDDGTVAAVQRDGTCARRYGTAGSAAVKSAAFLPGKGVLCCGCSDRTVRAYHADSCALLATVVDVHMDAVVRLDAAPLAADGRAALASADLSGVVALHVFPRTGDTAVLAGTFAVPDGGVPVGLALAPRQGPARALFVASASGTVTRWDCAAAAAGVLGAGAPVPAWTTRTHAACQALARAGDAAVAVVGSGHNVALVHGDTGRVTHKWKAGAAPGAPSLTCVDCTKDGGVVAVGTAAGTVLLYDVRKTSAPFATAVAADGRRVAAVRFLKATGTAGSGTAQSTRSVSQRRAAAAPPPAAPSARAAPSANSSSAGAVQPSPIQKRTVHLELDGTVDQIAQAPLVPPAVAAAATTWDTTVSSDVSQEASLNPPPSKQPRAAQSQRALVESARALMAGDSTAAAAAPWMAAGSRSMASPPPRLPPAPAPATGATLTQRDIENAKAEILEQVHRDIVNMHADMVRGFEELREEVNRVLTQSLRAVDAVVQENTRLKEEIRQLKHLY